MQTLTDTPSLPETVVAALIQSVGQLLRRVRADANPGGLNLSQTSVLGLLNENGAMTPADLARAQAITPQSMGAILNGLERQGLVERHRHPRDGRQILISLTERGQDAKRTRSMAKQAWLLAAIARLDPEQQRTLLAAAAILRDLSRP